MRTLLTHCKTSTQKSGIFLQSTKRNDDVMVMGRFTRNKLQWNKNDIKAVKRPMETTKFLTFSIELAHFYFLMANDSLVSVITFVRECLFRSFNFDRGHRQQETTEKQKEKLCPTSLPAKRLKGRKPLKSCLFLPAVI